MGFHVNLKSVYDSPAASAWERKKMQASRAAVRWCARRRSRILLAPGCACAKHYVTVHRNRHHRAATRAHNQTPKYQGLQYNMPQIYLLLTHYTHHNRVLPLKIKNFQEIRLTIIYHKKYDNRFDD